MSWKVQALVADRICGSTARKMVLLNMAARANDDGSGIFTSLPTIAAWCEMDARSSRRITRALEDDELIEITARRTIKNGYVNEWRINVEKVAALRLVQDELEERRKNKTLAGRADSMSSVEKSTDTGHRVRAGIGSGRTQRPAGNKSPRTMSPATPDIESAKSIQETDSPPMFPSETPPKGGAEAREADRSQETNPPVSKPKSAAEDRGSRLPEDWALDDALIAYCAAHDYTTQEAAYINHRFVNHWLAQSGARARKKDWRRTFQNWVTNEDRRRVKQNAAAWRAPEVIDWSDVFRIWEASDRTYWNRDKFGPAPGEDGYRGPALDAPGDLFATGGRR